MFLAIPLIKFTILLCPSCCLIALHFSGFTSQFIDFQYARVCHVSSVYRKRRWTFHGSTIFPVVTFAQCFQICNLKHFKIWYFYTFLSNFNDVRIANECCQENIEMGSQPGRFVMSENDSESCEFSFNWDVFLDFASRTRIKATPWLSIHSFKQPNVWAMILATK